METLEELKEIIAGKPEGADYITLCNNYIQIDGIHCRVFNPLDVWSIPVCNTSDIFIDDKPRSLSDIGRIIELMEVTQGMLQILAGSPDGYWRNEIKAAREALGYE